MTTKDPLRYFRVEAREISEALERDALELEAGANPVLVARMMRLAHTLKGAAGVVKQQVIADQTHALEDMLAPLRAANGAVDAETSAEILRQVDAIAANVAALAPARDRPAPAPTDFVADDAIAPLQADRVETMALAQGIAATGVQLRGLRRAADLAGEARQLAGVLADRSDAVPGAGRQFAEELRQSVAAIEQLLRSGLDQGERALQSAHAATERLQLLPCSAAFAPLARAVRDAAQGLGKQAQFETAGGEIRIDAQVLRLVQRALIQLLRNAVSHGIELPAERTAAGKPTAGRVAVRVERKGSRVAFACSDDGSGVDLEAVRRAAGRGDAASGAELLALLLEGGVSTSATVTQAAGRGVGLDVVRDIAARLGGEVRAESARGRGTTIEIIVPVSLSSLDALIAEHGSQRVAVPLASVVRALRLAPEDVVRAADRDTVTCDGTALPFLPLANVLPGAATPTTTRTALVVASDRGRAAIGVDRLRGVANIVVRPVPPLAFADEVVAGLYIDAEGAPQPVLDSDALVRRAATVAAQPIKAAKRQAPILVIDDSLTTRVLEQSILESAGYAVELATSAEEALEKARQRRYALFLVDVEMPGMDGFTFIETTRADPALRTIPAILVTSRAAPEDRERGRAAGARGYVVKSEFDQAQVLATIRALVEQS